MSALLPRNELLFFVFTFLIYFYFIMCIIILHNYILLVFYYFVLLNLLLCFIICLFSICRVAESKLPFLFVVPLHWVYRSSNNT